MWRVRRVTNAKSRSGARHMRSNIPSQNRRFRTQVPQQQQQATSSSQQINARSVQNNGVTLECSKSRNMSNNTNNANNNNATRVNRQCRCAQCDAERKEELCKESRRRAAGVASNAGCIGPPRPMMDTLVYCQPCVPKEDCVQCDNGSDGDSGAIDCGDCRSWQDYPVESVDANFSVARVFSARFTCFGATLLLRLHVRGRHSFDDSTISLSLPDGVRASTSGQEEQFCFALIRSDDTLTFAPGRIAPGSTSITLTHRSLRAGVMYDIWFQTFVEIDLA